MFHERRSTVVAVVLAVLTVATGFAAVGAAAPVTPASSNVQDAVPFQVTDESNATTITTSAVGQVEAEPDQAVVLVSSTAVADDPANATARLAENVSSMRAALSAANLSADQVVTTDFNVFQQTVGEPPNQTTRFVAQQGFEITLDDVNRSGEVVDVALENGATEVRGVSFTLSEASQEELRNQALGEAMTSARSQAETVAAAENLTITGVRSVQTGDGGVQPVEARALAEAAPTGTQIDGGPVTVTATVRVTYVAGGTTNATA